MNKKEKTAMIVFSILTGGVAYLGYCIGEKVGEKSGVENGVRKFGEMLFNGEIEVQEFDPETGKTVTKYVDPVLKDGKDIIIDVDQEINIVHK